MKQRLAILPVLEAGLPPKALLPAQLRIELARELMQRALQHIQSLDVTVIFAPLSSRTRNVNKTPVAVDGSQFQFHHPQN